MNSIVITSRVAELDFRRPALLQRARGELSLESLSLVTPTVPLSRRPKTKHNDYMYQKNSQEPAIALSNTRNK